MEPALRGLNEKVIDEGIKPDTLENTRLSLRGFEYLIKSEADVIFGHLIGTVRTSLFCYTLALYNRKPARIDSFISRRTVDFTARKVISCANT